MNISIKHQATKPNRALCIDKDEQYCIKLFGIACGLLYASKRSGISINFWRYIPSTIFFIGVAFCIHRLFCTVTFLYLIIKVLCSNVHLRSLINAIKSQFEK